MGYAVLVRIAERARHFAKDSHRLGHRQLSHQTQFGAQRLALDERHREVRRSIRFSGREQRDDVRVLEFRCELYLSAKALEAQLGGDFGRENLYNDLAPEAPVHRHEHATHSRAHDLSLEAVAIAEGTLEGRAKVRHSS